MESKKNDCEKEMFTDNLEDPEYEAYRNFNNLEAKQFYHQHLESLVQSVKCQDIKKFQKSAKLLDRINKWENKDRVQSYFEDEHPLSKTNILLLSCEHPENSILGLILSNYCNILHWNTVRPPVSPTDENDEGKNAYYYAMRCNNISILRDLVEKWPIEIDDIALSKSYFNLILQGVNLTDDIKNFVEYTLTRTRLEQCIFGNIEQPKGSPKKLCNKLLGNIKMRSLFLVDCINNLILSHDNDVIEVNEKILFCLKVIAINLYVLKGRLRCTYDRLPWEEIEFCLVTFIKHFDSTDESGIFYRSYLNKENIFEFLKEFSVELSNISATLSPADLQIKFNDTREETIAKISSNNSTFKNLYKTFAEIRDFYSLEKMLHYLSYALRPKKLEDITESDEILLIERCLHILGESMKNTVTSPNLSKDLGDFISDCFSEYPNKALQHIRDCLSHHNKLRCRMDSSHDNIMKIKDELIGITPIIEQIFLRIKYTKWQEICNESKDIKNFKELRHLKEILNYEHIELSDIVDPGKCRTFRIIDIFMKLKSEALRIRGDLQLELDEAEECLYNFAREFSLNEEGINKLMLTIINSIRIIDSLRDEETIGRNIECLKHKMELGNLKISKLQTLNFHQEFYISALLKKIIGKCMSSDNFNQSNLIMCEANICSLLIIGRTDFKSIKNLNKDLSKKKEQEGNNKSGHNQKPNSNSAKSQSVQANKTFLEDMLEVKINHLKSILERHNVEDSFDSVNSFILSHGKKKIFYVLEMLLLDILSICEDDLNFNTNLLDFYFPTLIGKELRNHLAHGNSVFEILSFNMKLCITVNCVAIVNHKPHPGKVIKPIPNQLYADEAIKLFHFNSRVLQSKIDFFELLQFSPLHEIVNVPGVDILARSFEGFTILHAAAYNSDVEVFNHYLHKMGKQLYLLDNENIFKQNLIHVAALSNNLKVMENILEKANSVILLKSFDYKGYIPLHYASSFGTTDMVRLLLRYQQNSVYIYSKNNVETISNSRTTITLPTVRPIHKAMQSNQIEIFKMLLDHERDLSAELTDEKPSVVHLAAEHENPKFIKILVNRGVNVNMKHTTGFAPLHSACYFGRLENVKILLSKNADLNARIFDTTKETPISFAISKNNTEVVKYLLTKDLDLHYIDEGDHHNLLHTAAANAGPDIIEGLIERGMSLNGTTIEGATILHVAVAWNNHVAIETFLKYGLNVNAIDYLGLTPLHYAALMNNKEMFELLYKHKAQSNIIDNLYGATATQIVLLLGDIDMMQSLANLNIPIHNKENWKWVAYNNSMDMIRTFLKECGKKHIKKSKVELSELFFIAVINSNIDLFKYLISLGGNFDYSINDVTPLLKPLRTFAPFFCTKAIRKVKLPARPLDLAIAFNNLYIIQILLENYVNHEQKTYCFRKVQASELLHGNQKVDNALTGITKCLIKNKAKQECLQRLLKSAVLNNNIDAVLLLLELKLNIDLEILAIAMENGYMSLCKLLIDKGKINLKSKLNNDEGILHIAVQYCDTSIVELLITKGCNLNATNNEGLRPIDYAAHTGHATAVEALLDNGADVGISLFAAIELDYSRIVSMLCERGVHLKYCDRFGSSLHYAISKGSQKCIKVLLNADGMNMNVTGKDGTVPLHIAAYFGDLGVTRALLEKGANAHSECAKHWKPIHYASRHGHLNIVKYYIENGFIPSTETTMDGFSLLHFASCQKNIELVKFILQLNVNVNKKNDSGITALHFAARHSSWEVCSLLIDFGAIYNTIDKQNKTPYHLANDETKSGLSLIESLESAFQKGNTDFCKFLEANYSNVNLNARFSKGSGLLHTFVEQRNERIVKLLLKYKADPNVLDSKLNTPLHFAVKLSNASIAKALLAAGAVYDLKNCDHLTAIELATNDSVKRELSIIDECFQCLEGQQANFLDLIRSMEKREDQIRVMFGPRNRQNQSLHTYIVKHEMSSLQTEVEKYLKRNIEHNEATWRNVSDERECRKAVNILLKDISEYEKEFGPNNPLTLDLRSRLLEIWFEIKNFKICLQENEKIIEELIGLYGESDIKVLASRSFQAAIHQELGDYKTALSICEYVCEKQLRLLGSSHEAVLLSKSRKAKALEALGQLEEALEIHREVYNKRKVSFGENHSLTLTSFGDIGSVLNNQGKIAEAADIFCFLYSKRLQILGLVNNETLDTLSRYIETLIMRRKYIQAVKELKSTYDLLIADFEPTHPKTVEIMNKFTRALTTPSDVIILKNIHPFLQASFPHGSLPLSISREDTITAKTDHELQSLFESIRKGDCAALLWMIETNRELVNISDKNRVTPLHLAVESNNFQIFSLLRVRGADPNRLTVKRESILHVAVKNGYIEMTKTIIDHIQKSFKDELNGFLDKKNLADGETALHIAAKANSYAICLLLLQKGACYNALSKSRKLPVDLTSDHSIKTLFKIIYNTFVAVESNDSKRTFQIIEQNSPDLIEALKCCRNSENKTLVQCAPQNMQQQLAMRLSNQSE